MRNKSIPTAAILAELLRIQRGMAGDSIEAARIFGLAHGFESVIDSERESFGISRKQQDAAEDILDEIDRSGVIPSGMTLKERIRSKGLEDHTFGTVAELCLLEGRYTDVVQKLAKAGDCRMIHCETSTCPTNEWRGPQIYMELVYSSPDSEKKTHSVFSPVVPRVGDIIEPEAGELMKVVAVHHAAIQLGENENAPQAALTPFVYLEPAKE